MWIQAQIENEVLQPLCYSQAAESTEEENPTPRSIKPSA